MVTSRGLSPSRHRRAESHGHGAPLPGSVRGAGAARTLLAAGLGFGLAVAWYNEPAIVEQSRRLLDVSGSRVVAALRPPPPPRPAPARATPEMATETREALRVADARLRDARAALAARQWIAAYRQAARGSERLAFLTTGGRATLDGLPIPGAAAPAPSPSDDDPAAGREAAPESPPDLRAALGVTLDRLNDARREACEALLAPGGAPPEMLVRLFRVEEGAPCLIAGELASWERHREGDLRLAAMRGVWALMSQAEPGLTFTTPPGFTPRQAQTLEKVRTALAFEYALEEYACAMYGAGQRVPGGGAADDERPDRDTQAILEERVTELRQLRTFVASSSLGPAPPVGSKPGSGTLRPYVAVERARLAARVRRLWLCAGRPRPASWLATLAGAGPTTDR
ncbi:MAG: hypothetical protein HY719_01450 [Planctomycetes bacterium]|nr:hypothetical protein [Planctomycetota bacterium]